MPTDPVSAVSESSNRPVRPATPQRPGTRIVFVTRWLPLDGDGFERGTHGLVSRMRALLEAAQPLADVLHVVSFVDGALAGDETLQASVGALLASRWGVAARVTLVPERAMPKRSTLAHYLVPARSALLDPEFGGTAGAAQAQAVSALLAPDVAGVVVHRLSSVWPFLAERAPSGLPLVLDLDDIEHRKRMRAINAWPMRPGKLAAYLGLPALFGAELRAIGRARCTFVCSDHDQRYLSHLAGASRIEVLPNSARFPAAAPADPGVQSLLFIGTFAYQPNIDAAEQLIHRLWPRIRARCPAARLLIAGQRPDNIRGAANPPPGVEVLGFVDDIAALYAQVRVACCPIRVGGGTRVKIIEAAGFGRAVVSTPLGAEGLVFQPPDEIRIARDDDAFVAACIELLTDPGRAMAIGAAARQRALQAYDRAQVIAHARACIAAGFGLAAVSRDSA